MPGSEQVRRPVPARSVQPRSTRPRSGAISIGAARSTPQQAVAARQRLERQDDAAQEQTRTEEAARRDPLRIGEFTGRCDTIIHETRVANHQIYLYKQGTDREKKRDLGRLLTEIPAKHDELMERYLELSNTEVMNEMAPEVGRKKRAMLSIGIKALQDLEKELSYLHTQRDALGEKLKTPAAKRNYFQDKLRSGYPANCELHQMIKYVTALPEQSPDPMEEEEGQSAMEQINEFLSEASDQLEDNPAVNGLANIFNAVTNGYKFFIAIRKAVKKRHANWNEITEMVGNITSIIDSTVKFLDTTGLKAVASSVPVVGSVIGILMAVMNGVGHVITLVHARKNKTALVDVEHDLEERMLKNRQKEAQFGNSMRLDTEMRKNHWYSFSGTERERLLEGRENREAMRQRLHMSVTSGTNIYAQKLALKKERSAEMAKDNPDPQRIVALDSEIGRLRMVQDADRLGVTTEGKVKQNNRMKGASVGLAEVAADMASSIAKLCPGIGTVVGESIDKVKKISQYSTKFVRWIYSMTSHFKRQEQVKAIRRDALADTIMDRIDMLGTAEFDLQTLESQPSHTLNEHVLKAAFKGYDDLNVDLSRSLGITPKSLMVLNSRAMVRKTLAESFSAK